MDVWFNTDNGVFSKQKLDFGTRSLLENIPLGEIKGDVLEVGCGYGPIPIILSKVCDDVLFDAVDINKRSLHLAEMNMKLNDCSNINFFESNCYDNISKKYNVIISNPPIRAGKEIVYKIIMGAKDYLLPGGKMFIVINKDQGAKTVFKDLENVYETSLIKKNKGFWIIKCILR